MSKPSQVESVFFAAVEQKNSEERAAFLESACAGDAELRRQVQRLLNAHRELGDFLKGPAAEQLTEAPTSPDATQEIGRVSDRDSAGISPREGSGLAETEDDGSSKDEDDTLDFLQPSTRPDSLGRIGHYEALEVLGRGGFGTVFRAFDERLHRVVAIKVLAAQIAATSPARKRFLREARSSAKIRHPNVVQVYAVEEQPLPYLAMEFIPGETLQQRLIMGAGAKEIRLKPGSYTVEARKDGKVVRQELVTVAQNGRRVVRVSHEAVPRDANVPRRSAEVSAWERVVAALSADEQAKAVSARLKELNPGFDGALVPTIENGVVREVTFNTDDVTDISPVRGLTRLRSLKCSGSGDRKSPLTDLSPLSGLALRTLNLCKGELFDLSPLNGMPLTVFSCYGTRVNDLSPLKGMKLRILNCDGLHVSNLSPLKGMPLEILDLTATVAAEGHAAGRGPPHAQEHHQPGPENPPRHEEPQKHRHRLEQSLAGCGVLGALREGRVQGVAWRMLPTRALLLVPASCLA